MSSDSANPFKGLQPYSRADREWLFGRDRDLILMKDRIFSARTTLLFAGSGVGKTSFLNAKIIPELEDQYCIFYHNRWAGPAKPLDAVKSTLLEKIEPAKMDGTLLEILQQFKRNVVSPAAEPFKNGGGDGVALPTQCLLIFDQFEEIFQYHAYEDYFKRFLNELCDVIRKDEYRVHVVFSMREEFLGELSVFDNIIPDLFNNYYRLKYPDTREARQIIDGTCHLAHTRVHQDGLKQIISDLSKIEKGAAGGGERSTGAGKTAEHIVERDFIIPPYLQIVCHRQWQNQTAKLQQTETENFQFLADYQPGQAQQILDDFCQEKLSALTFMEQNMAAESFDFLVTKQGAKMAYEFTSLVDHMRIRFYKGALRRALEKLSNLDTRILRKSHGPGGSIWFELYHDIYGKILDTWRQSFRQKKRRLAVAASLGTLLLLLILIPVTLYWIVFPRSYMATLRAAHLEKSAEFKGDSQAYNSLAKTFGYKRTADVLWSKAWAQRAAYAESRDKRDEAIISWLQALSLDPNGPNATQQRLKLANLTTGSYQLLRGSLPHENAIGSAVFSIDGQIIVTQSRDRKICVWNGITAEMIGRCSNVPSREPAADPQTGAGSQSVQPTPDQNGSLKSTKPKDNSGLAAAEGNSNSADQQYRVLATASQPDSGWLIAAASTNEIERVNLRFAERKAPRVEYHQLPLSILSSNGEVAVLPDAIGVMRNERVVDRFGAAFSADGKFVATVGKGQTARVWKKVDKAFVPANGFKMNGLVTDVQFSPDSRSLLAVDRDKLTMWDVDSGKLRYSPVRAHLAQSPVFSPDNHTFAAVVLDDLGYLLQVWNAATGKPVGAKIYVGTYYETLTPKISLTPDGKVILVRSASAQVFDIQSGELQTQYPWLDVNNLSQNGEMLLDVQDQEARLYQLGADARTGITLKADYDVFEAVLTQDSQRIVALMAEEPRGIRPLSLDEAKKVVQVWDAKTGAPVGPLISAVVALSADGEFVAKREGPKGPIQILSLRTGVEVLRLTSLGSETLTSLIASPKGSFLATVANREVAVWAQGESSEPLFRITENSYRSSVYAFSPDERFFAFYTEDNGRIRIYDFSTKQFIELTNNLSQVAALSFNNQGQLIAGGVRGRIWDVAKRESLYADLEPGTRFDTLAVAPDAKTALTCDSNGSEILWRFPDNGRGELIQAEIKHSRPVWSVAFSDDGKAGIILVSGWLHIINVHTGDTQRSHFFTENIAIQCRSMNSSAIDLRCISRESTRTIRVADLRSGVVVGTTPVIGDPLELLELWKKKLSRTIADDGQIVPTGVKRASTVQAPDPNTP